MKSLILHYAITKNGKRLATHSVKIDFQDNESPEDIKFRNEWDDEVLKSWRDYGAGTKLESEEIIDAV